MTNTFVMIKPDATADNCIGGIISMLEDFGQFKVIAMKFLTLTVEQAEEFYVEHKDKPFFSEIIDFMTSGPVVPMVLEHEGDAVQAARAIIGGTQVDDRPIGTIRFVYGSGLMENAIHGSDSEESAKREMKLFLDW